MGLEEIAQGIHVVTSPLGEREFAQVVVAGEGRTVLIDTGVADTPREVLVPALRAAGLPAPDLIVVSHADVDHCGGNRAALERWPQARIATHALDRDWVASNDAMLAGNYLWYRDHGFDVTDADRDGIAAMLGGDAPVHTTLTHGEMLDLGGSWAVEVLHLPGHTPGHLGLWDARSHTAIVIDAVLGRGIADTHGTLTIPPRVYDTAAYRATVETLRALRPRTLVTAHFGTLTGDAVGAFLDDTLAHDVAVEALVRSALDGGERDLRTITERADAQLGPFADAPHELAAAVRDHLRRAGADAEPARPRPRDRPSG